MIGPADELWEIDIIVQQIVSQIIHLEFRVGVRLAGGGYQTAGQRGVGLEPNVERFRVARANRDGTRQVPGGMDENESAGRLWLDERGHTLGAAALHQFQERSARPGPQSVDGEVRRFRERGPNTVR